MYTTTQIRVQKSLKIAEMRKTIKNCEIAIEEIMETIFDGRYNNPFNMMGGLMQKIKTLEKQINAIKKTNS